MTAIELRLNGRPVHDVVEPRTHLADFVRERHRLTGTHVACEHGVCGACTLLVDDVPVRSCITFAAGCSGAEIRTIEDFDDDEVMDDLREAFSTFHGLQCGFCTPGMLIAARDIVLRLPDADEPRIRQELAGNLCRCTGYLGIVQAVGSVIAKRRGRAAVPVMSATPAAVPTVAFAPFIPSADAVVVTEVAPAAAVSGAETRGRMRFTESFVIGQPPEKAWAAFGDLPLVAACLPGAELLEVAGPSVKGRLSVRLGPIAAAFGGSAVIERDEAALTGTIRGAGSDSGSRSRTRGEITYRLSPEEGGRATRVDLAVEYDLQGPLAQFSRSGVAQAFGRRIIAEFARNLDERLGGTVVPAQGGDAARLNLGRLASETLWLRLKGLFRRRA